MSRAVPARVQWAYVLACLAGQDARMSAVYSKPVKLEIRDRISQEKYNDAWGREYAWIAAAPAIGTPGRYAVFRMEYLRHDLPMVAGDRDFFMLRLSDPKTGRRTFTRDEVDGLLAQADAAFRAEDYDLSPEQPFRSRLARRPRAPQPPPPRR